MNGLLNEDRLTVSNMKEGAVLEMVDAEIDRVMNNVIDPNSEPDEKRKITLTLTFAPNKERTQMVIKAQAKSTLAPDIAVDTIAAIGVEGTQGVANEVQPRQLELPTGPVPVKNAGSN